MKKVILKGLNKRGKDRVNNFGPKFVVLHDEKLTQWGEKTALFVSVKKSFRVGDNLVPWSGWLDIGTEVEIVEIVEEIS